MNAPYLADSKINRESPLNKNLYNITRKFIQVGRITTAFCWFYGIAAFNLTKNSSGSTFHRRNKGVVIIQSSARPAAYDNTAPNPIKAVPGQRPSSSTVDFYLFYFKFELHEI